MVEPEWLDLDVILEIHERNIARYGGSPGIRDLGLLESAVNRPRWTYEFDPAAGLYELAASYSFGIIKNHPFIDGNKRVGYVAGCTFLSFNGWHVAVGQADAVRTVLALAAGDIGETDFAQWLERNSEPTNPEN